MVYCEYKLKHSFNVIYEEKEHEPKFGFLLSAMEDPFSHTALSGMSINFENNRLRIDNGTFAYGGYIVQTYHPSYMCSPDFSGIGQGHIPAQIPSDDIDLTPGMENPPGSDDDGGDDEDDGTEPIIGEYKFTFDVKPGFSVRIAPSIDNHEFGIVKKFRLDYTNMINMQNSYTIDLTEKLADNIKFNQRKATFKWEDQNHIIINGFRDYVNKATIGIDNIQELSTSSMEEDTDGLHDMYEGTSIKLTVSNIAVIKIAISQDGTLIIMDELSSDYQLILQYLPDENNDAIMFFEELLVIDKQGLYPVPMYTYNVIGVNKIIQKEPTLNPTATIDSADYADYTTGFEWHKIDFQEEITTKVSEEIILDHIADKYYWLEIWTEEAIPVVSIDDINITDVSNMGSYVDEHVNGYSLTYDAGEHWLYINNIGGFTVRFPEYDPVVTTPIPKELINSLHDGVIYTDYEKFEFTTEDNPNNEIDVIEGEKQSYSIGITSIANGTVYTFDFYPTWDSDQSVVYHITYTSDENATVAEIYMGLVTDFQAKILTTDAIPTLIDGKLKIESARDGVGTINVDNLSNVAATILNNGTDEVSAEDNGSSSSAIDSLWGGSTDELQALIGDINTKLDEEDSTSYSNTVDEADTGTITQTLISNWEDSQTEGSKNKVLVTFQYYHDLNVIKFQVKDSYDLTRNDCILATLITEDAKSYYITYRDHEYPRMIPYAEWNEFDSYTYASKYLPSLGNETIPVDDTLIVPPGSGGTGTPSNLQGSPTILKITIPDDTVVGSYSFTIDALHANESYNVSYSVLSQENTLSIINGLYSSIISSVNAVNVTVNKTDVYLLIASSINGENTIAISNEQNVAVEVLSTGINNPGSYTNAISGSPKTYTFTFNPAAPNAVYSFDIVKNAFNVTVSFLTPNTVTQEELFDGLIVDFESKVPDSVASIEKVDLGDGTFSLKIIATELGTTALYVENVGAVATNPTPGDHTTYRVDIDHVANTNSYSFEYTFKDTLPDPDVEATGIIYYESDEDAELNEIKSAIITEINDNHSNFLGAMDPDNESPSIIIASAVQGPLTIELFNFQTQQLDNTVTATNTIISVTPEIVQENAIYGMILKDHSTGDELNIEYTGLIDDTSESIMQAITDQIQTVDVDGLYTVTFPPVGGIPAELNYISNDKIVSEDYTGYITTPVLLENGLLIYGNSSETIDTDYVAFYDTAAGVQLSTILAPAPLMMGRYGYSVDLTDKYYAISDPLDDKGKVYIYSRLDDSLVNTLDGETYSSLGWFGRKVTIIDETIIIFESHSTGNHKVFFINITDGAILNEISKSSDAQFGRGGVDYNTQNVFLGGTACVYMYDLDGSNEIVVTAHDPAIDDYSKRIQASDKYVILSGQADEIYIYDVTGINTIEYNRTFDETNIINQLGVSTLGVIGKHIALVGELLIFTNDTQVLAYHIADDTIFDTGFTFTNITGLAANSVGFVITETDDGAETDYGVHHITYEYIQAIPGGDGKTIFIESNTGGDMTFGIYNVSTLLINIEDPGEDLPQNGIITPSLIRNGSFENGAITIPGNNTTYDLNITPCKLSTYSFDYTFDDGSTTGAGTVTYTSSGNDSITEIKQGIISAASDAAHSAYITAIDNDTDVISIISAVTGANTITVSNIVAIQNCESPVIGEPKSINITIPTWTDATEYSLDIDNGSTVINISAISDATSLDTIEALLHEIQAQIGVADTASEYTLNYIADNGSGVPALTVTANINKPDSFTIMNELNVSIEIITAGTYDLCSVGSYTSYDTNLTAANFTDASVYGLEINDGVNSYTASVTSDTTTYTDIISVMNELQSQLESATTDYTFNQVSVSDPSDPDTITEVILTITSNISGLNTFTLTDNNMDSLVISDAGSDSVYACNPSIDSTLSDAGSADEIVDDPASGEVDPGSLEEVWVNINDIVITNNGSPSGSGQCSENVVSASMVVRLKYNAKFVGEYAGILAPGADLQYWGAAITDTLDDGEYVFEITVTTELGNSATAIDESVIIDVDGLPNIIPEPAPITCDVSDYDVVSSTLTQYSQAVALGKMLVYDFDKMLTIHDMSIENSNEITTTCAQAKSFLGIPLNQDATFHFNVPSDCTRMMLVPVLFGMSNEYDYKMTVNDMDIMTEHEFDHSMIYNSTSIDVKLTSRCDKMLLSGMVLLYDSKSVTTTNNLRINHQITRSAPMVDYIVIKGWENLTTVNLIESDFVKLKTSWNMVDPNSDDITVGIYFDNKYLVGESYEKNVNDLKFNLSKSVIMEKAAIFTKEDKDYLQVPITFRISNVNGTREVNKYILIRDLSQSEVKPEFDDMNKIIAWENADTEVKEYLFVPVVRYLDEIQYSIWFYEHQSNATPTAIYNNNKPATIIRHVYSFGELPAVCKFEVYDVYGNLADTVIETII